MEAMIARWWKIIYLMHLLPLSLYEDIFTPVLQFLFPSACTNSPLLDDDCTFAPHEWWIDPQCSSLEPRAYQLFPLQEWDGSEMPLRFLLSDVRLVWFRWGNFWRRFLVSQVLPPGNNFQNQNLHLLIDHIVSGKKVNLLSKRSAKVGEHFDFWIFSVFLLEMTKWRFPADNQLHFYVYVSITYFEADLLISIKGAWKISYLWSSSLQSLSSAAASLLYARCCLLITLA